MEKRRHNTRHAAALAAAAAFGESLTVPTYSASSEKGSVLQSKTTTVETKSGASKSSLNLSSFPLTETAESEPKSMFGHSLGDTPSPQDTWQNNNPQMASKRNMYEDFQLWAMKTYGDSAKTKTVTRRKYNRILKILKGEEQTNAENSKFRFWVKAKGFRIGRPADRNSDSKKSDQVIYIPCSKANPSGCENSTTYKKVAVVENFFDIIYGVHVEMDGRGGKHAGQKRTYKAIAEMYSFLPREAVTHFLMSCSDCQKRMHFGGVDANKSSSSPSGLHDNAPPEQQEELSAGSELSSSPDEEATGSSSLHIDYCLPITTTYLKHMKSLGYSEEDALNPDSREDSEDVDSETSEDPNTASTQAISSESYDMHMEEVGSDENPVRESNEATLSGPLNHPIDMRQKKQNTPIGSTTVNEPLNMTKFETFNSQLTDCIGEEHPNDGTTSPCNGCNKREASTTPDDLSAGTKEEDDDDEEDDGDKMDSNTYDPERLKAFNMFVRLFVDENLDRMVPISRQPKDKIQAIIDSCSRQFPEFGERARKRIRTYLKSCRRNKRTRENNSLEMGRSTHPHLTSAQAEQILAVACENESQNAKRMRLGLKPISVDNDRSRHSFSTQSAYETDNKSSISKSPHQDNIVHSTLRRPTYIQASTYQGVSASSACRHLSNATDHPSTSVQNSSIENIGPTLLGTGPTDLSVKKCSGNPPNKALKYSLNPSEVAAVKQLIAGYRESAAFLLRSADELEQLLLQ